MRERAVAEGHVLLVGAARRDDVPERRQRLVDVLGLLQRLARGAGLVDALAAREVDLRGEAKLDEARPRVGVRSRERRGDALGRWRGATIAGASSSREAAPGPARCSRPNVRAALDPWTVST